MRPVVRHGLARLRRDRARTGLVVIGIAASAAMVGAAVTMIFALASAFDRTAAKAAMPDVTATFDQQSRAAVAGRVRTLANVRAAAYRYEERNVSIAEGDRFATADLVRVRPGPPRGYALVAGRDLRDDADVVVEAGLAHEWRLHVGDRITVAGSPRRVVGVAVTPGTIAYPLSRSPRL